MLFVTSIVQRLLSSKSTRSVPHKWIQISVHQIAFSKQILYNPCIMHMTCLHSLSKHNGDASKIWKSRLSPFAEITFAEITHPFAVIKQHTSRPRTCLPGTARRWREDQSLTNHIQHHPTLHAPTTHLPAAVWPANKRISGPLTASK